MVKRKKEGRAGCGMQRLAGCNIFAANLPGRRDIFGEVGGEAGRTGANIFGEATRRALYIRGEYIRRGAGRGWGNDEPANSWRVMKDRVLNPAPRVFLYLQGIKFGGPSLFRDERKS